MLSENALAGVAVGTVVGYPGSAPTEHNANEQDTDQTVAYAFQGVDEGVLTGLAGRFFLLRYDERGNGLSDWDAEFSFDSFVSDLETVVDHVQPERHEAARRAKDVAAGAVLLAFTFEVVVAAAVVLPALLDRG